MFEALLIFQTLGPKPCVVVNGSTPAKSWLVKTVSPPPLRCTVLNLCLA